MTSVYKVFGVLVGAALGISACSDPAQSSASNVERSSINDTDLSDDTIAPADNTTTLADEQAPSVDNSSAEDKLIDDLIQYRWILVDALSVESQPLTSLLDIKNQVTASFIQRQGKNSLIYSVGCNTMSAGYQLQGNEMTIDNSMSTKMSCADLDLVENRLNDLMQGVNQLELTNDKDNGSILTQITDNGVTLQWRGKMTAKAKYGSRGETIFWAIDAQTTPCTDNSAQVCLQVKPVVYDDQGIKVSEGERVEFAGTIDGYEHSSEFDQVLRLHRYALNASNDSMQNASNNNYAYVLDTIVEQTEVN